jgi:glycosyltransferase involved in cell wall biosynthesis
VLSEKHEVHVTDWVADFYSLRDYFSRRYLQNYSYRLFQDGKITVHGIPRISPALFISPLRRLNSAIFSQTVARIIKQYHIDVVVGTFVIRPPRAPRLIFDLFDDNPAYWRIYGRYKQYADEIEQTELAYFRTADAVVAASSTLSERAKKNTTRPVYLIPNGVDTDRFRNADGSAFRARWGAPGCVVGLLGNHDRPTELRAMLDAARRLTDENISFIVAGRGSAIPDSKRYASKNGIPGIQFIGKVPLQSAAEVVAAFDLGLCLYSKTPADDARSPMRLLMYAAAGLPIVCTDLEEVRRMQFPNVVLVADDPLSIAEGIRRARRMPRSIPAQIAAYDLHRLTAQFEQVLKG